MAPALALLPRAAAVRLAAREGCLPTPPLRRSRAGEGASPSPSSPAARSLVVYTKPGCCLCDGIKEKLHAVFLLAGTPHQLTSVELQGHHDESGVGADVPVRDPGAHQGACRRQRGKASQIISASKRGARAEESICCI